MTIVEEIDKAKENLWKTYGTVKEEQDAGRVSAEDMREKACVGQTLKEQRWIFH